MVIGDELFHLQGSHRLMSVEVVIEGHIKFQLTKANAKIGRKLCQCFQLVQYT
jgi:hypothetical protein